ncbi:anti-sigma-I factor RsgI family protein [Clostridium pasteurianum]|uniref:Anti-sigma factor RsgI-like middle domain-containing protein n=1 Tax=Clostridium pasteurianum BC1 TaxID=86416 RepID=R4K434_CLOPA|nr:hypothetical protein [Clostridium pasteurianum]AGK95299.1 hypothetical protein Clopa_0233 [Clostridium pasteurianum BC1]
MDKITGAETVDLEEFKLKKNKSLPRLNKVKNPLIILFISIILLFIIAYYIYSYSSSLVIIDVGTSINLKVNKYGKVVDASSLTSGGNNIINESNVNNKNISEALIIILSKAEANNYIDPLDKNQFKHNISVFISGDTLDISKFSDEVKTKKLNLNINENGSEKNNR